MQLEKQQRNLTEASIRKGHLSSGQLTTGQFTPRALTVSVVTAQASDQRPAPPTQPSTPAGRASSGSGRGVLVPCAPLPAAQHAALPESSGLTPCLWGRFFHTWDTSCTPSPLSVPFGVRVTAPCHYTGPTGPTVTHHRLPHSGEPCWARPLHSVESCDQGKAPARRKWETWGHAAPLGCPQQQPRQGALPKPERSQHAGVRPDSWELPGFQSTPQVPRPWQNG